MSMPPVQWNTIDMVEYVVSEAKIQEAVKAMGTLIYEFEALTHAAEKCTFVYEVEGRTVLYNYPDN